MNRISTRTKNLLSAAACTVALAAGAAVASPQPDLPNSDQAATAEAASAVEQAEEHVVVTEPLYVIVAQKPGAPMATGDLPVETITFDAPTRVQVYRSPAGAIARAQTR